MDCKIDEHEHYWEDCPLGVFLHDLVEGILGDLVWDDSWVKFRCILVVCFEIRDDLILEFCDVGFLVIFSIIQRFVSDIS